jgi:hypothetical protein
LRGADQSLPHKHILLSREAVSGAVHRIKVW